MDAGDVGDGVPWLSVRVNESLINFLQDAKTNINQEKDERCNTSTRGDNKNVNLEQEPKYEALLDIERKTWEKMMIHNPDEKLQSNHVL